MFFSVVIPTYNNALLLKRALKSLQSQTYSNYEVVIIDNYSNDDTEKVIRSFSFKNIIYKKINNGGIIAKSRNAGIKISNGDWILFLDSDDTFYPDKIKFLSENINSAYDLVCNAQKIVTESNDNIKIWKYGPYEKNFYKKMLIDGNRFSTSASAVSKFFLKENNIHFNERKDFVTAEDYDFFLNLVNANARVKFFNNVLGGHYNHKDSQSSNYKLHKSSIVNVIKYHIFSVQKFNLNHEQLWKSLKWRFLLMDFLEEVKKKNITASIKILIRIFFKSPLQLSKFFLLKLKKKYTIS
jgi:glycosyltransferase involved in cell wall biosynthesis